MKTKCPDSDESLGDCKTHEELAGAVKGDSFCFTEGLIILYVHLPTSTYVYCHFKPSLFFLLRFYFLHWPQLNRNQWNLTPLGLRF